MAHMHYTKSDGKSLSPRIRRSRKATSRILTRRGFLSGFLAVGVMAGAVLGGGASDDPSRTTGKYHKITYPEIVSQAQLSCEQEYADYLAALNALQAAQDAADAAYAAWYDCENGGMSMEAAAAFENNPQQETFSILDR